MKMPPSSARHAHQLIHAVRLPEDIAIETIFSLMAELAHRIQPILDTQEAFGDSVRVDRSEHNYILISTHSMGGRAVRALSMAIENTVREVLDEHMTALPRTH